MPVLPIVAALVLLLLHTPPVVVLVRVILLPVQTIDGPDIAATVDAGLTVSTFVAKQVAPVR
jgi:hypothetical protein